MKLEDCCSCSCFEQVLGEKYDGDKELDMKERYNDGCRWKNIIWSLVVDME
jgi:hypothetical protein